MSKTREELRQRAWRTIVSRSFFSAESAIIIAMSIVLFGLGFQPFDWWQPAYWLLFGTIAEALYLGATITDPKAANRAVNAMLTDKYTPTDVKSPVAREQLKRALEYHELIREAALRHRGGMRNSIENTASEINAWVEQIYKLARRMDNFEENDVITRDRRMVPQDLKNLRRRMDIEKNDLVRQELEEAIQTKETQLANLRTLENNLKRAEIQLDQTVTSLATVYTQIQLIDSKDIDSARTNRLEQSIREEVLSLEDTISAIDEVNAYQASSSF